MELYSVDLKKYKNLFMQAVVIGAVFIAASYLLVTLGFTPVVLHDTRKQVVFPFIGVLCIIAFAHTINQKKQLNKLLAIEDFDQKLELHERIYKVRLAWYIISCLFSCCLYVLLGSTFFLLFSLFDVASLFPHYPAKSLFKKELNNNEIVFY